MNTKPSIQTVRKFSKPIRSVLRTGSVEIHDEEFIAWTAVYDVNGKLIEETKYFDDGDIEEFHQYKYDEKGNVLLHLIEVPGEGIEERFITERNELGNPIKITKMYGDDPGEYTLYTYRTNSKPIQIEQFDADGEKEHTEHLSYNEQGLLEKKHVINHQENTENIYLFSFNEKGWLMLQEEQDAKGMMVNTLEFEYDSEGKETHSIQKNETGKKIASVQTFYNDLGKLVRRESHSFYVRISTFDYDEAGNLIEEGLSDENDFVITRNRFSYDENNMLIEETVYETDLTRAGRDTHLNNRYEYEFHVD